MAVKHLLILGGTAEARELARRVAITIPKKVRVTTSLAGRRAKAPALPGDVRIGGFGGIDGLVDYINENAVDLVIDATHPFSAIISDHANAAAVGFAPGGDAEQMAKRVWHAPIVRQNRVCCNSGAFNEKTGGNWLVP